MKTLHNLNYWSVHKQCKHYFFIYVKVILSLNLTKLIRFMNFEKSKFVVTFLSILKRLNELVCFYEVMFS